MIKKILLGLGITFGVLILLMIIMVTTVNFVLSSEKGDNMEKLEGSLQPPQKALVIYQPALGSITTDVAHEVAKGLNDNGYEVILNNPGKHLSADISEYSVVVFGSPTYASQPSKVLTGYMSEIKDAPSAKVVIFSTGLNPESLELEVMEDALNNIKPYRKIKFNSAEKEKSNTQAYQLGKELSKE